MALRLAVCKVDEVPATGYAVFSVEGLDKPVLVARVGHRLVATSGICPHEDVELAGGDREGDRIVCPGHAYEFDLVTGRCMHDRTLELKRFKTYAIDDTVYIDAVTA